MIITHMLPNAVLVNQLSEKTSDGKADEDARMNCVAASLSAGIHCLTGQTVYGDTLKDAVYGQGYVGMQAPATYAASRFLASLGVTMTPYNGHSGAALVAHIHSELAAGHPVVVTIPSQWGTPPPDPIHPSGYTHVVCAVGWGPGWIRCMNPWGGFWHDGDDTYWAARLCYGQIWTLARKGGSDAMSWTKQSDGTGKDAHGHTCGAGDMAYIQQHSLTVVDGLMSETYYATGKSFLPLDSGQIVTWDGQRVAEDGAQVLVAVWQQLQAAKAGDTPPAPVDPLATKALAQLTGLKAFLGEL